MRRATVRTTHASPGVAALVARAIEPDNTESMATRVDGDVVETTIGRETTGGLHSSVDDYVVNLTVATRVAALEAEGPNTTAVTDTRAEQPPDHTDTRHDNDTTHE